MQAHLNHSLILFTTCTNFLIYLYSWAPFSLPFASLSHLPFRLPKPHGFFFFLLLYHLFISLVVSGKESPCSRYRRWEFHHWVKKISWRRARQPTPVFLPGESHGQRSLAGHGSQSHKRVRHDLATQKRLFILLILRLLIIFFMVVEESMGKNLSCKKSVNC